MCAGQGLRDLSTKLCDLGQTQIAISLAQFVFYATGLLDSFGEHLGGLIQFALVKVDTSQAQEGINNAKGVALELVDFQSALIVTGCFVEVA